MALCGALLAVLVAAGGAGAVEGPAPAFEAHGSVEQVYATGLSPGASVSLYDSQGQVVETRSANDLGGILFRNVAPGGGYRVGSGGAMSEPLQVLTTASEPPDTGFYDQSIPESGYGYLTTRDGTEAGDRRPSAPGRDPRAARGPAAAAADRPDARP